MGLKEDYILLDLQAYSCQKNFPKHFRALKVMGFQTKSEVYLYNCNNGPSIHCFCYYRGMQPFYLYLFLITSNKTLATS